MDRKSIIILVVSFVLLLLWFPLTSKIWPPKPLPATNVTAGATGQLAQATNVAMAATNITTSATTNIAALPIPPGAPEETLTLTHGKARYTFTSHGGGIKFVELVGEPQVTCAPKGSKESTNWVALNKAPVLPVMAVFGDPALIGDGVFALAQSSNGVRAEKRLTNDLYLIKQFDMGSNNLLRVTARLENRSAQPIKVGAHQWAIGMVAPQEADEAENLRGLYWYDGKDSTHIDAAWFPNRGFWSCLGMPSAPRPLYRASSTNVAWAAVHNRFFALGAIAQQPAQEVQGREAELGGSPAPARGKSPPPKGIQASLAYPETVLQPNQTLERTFHIFAGPREYKILQRIALALDNNFDRIMGFGWFGLFAQLLLSSMNGLYAMGLSYAGAIIAITVIIKLLFWPLTQASTRSMKRMSALQPQMKAIQEKYKEDPVKMNRKMMEFMKEHKVNPLGGCLPMLLQVPVFIGFYQMIQSAIELRGERFLWACDLSKPDTVWIIPGFGFPLNLLPLIMGATMLWQARLTPPSPGMDPVQQKIMRYMPLMFLVILYNFSAGLTLYWTVQNLLTIAQMKLTRAKEEPAAAPRPGAPAAKPTPAPPKKRK